MRNPLQSSSANMGLGQRRPTPTPCCSKVGMKRGPWTAEEDELLASFVRREGEGRWRTLPKRAGLLRCGKSCRLRWMNYLRPSIKHGPIAPDEEDLILRLHRLLGNRWSLIAGRIPGRTDNEIKNYWNTHLSKKLIKQGIDPRTHKPFTTSSTDPNFPAVPLPSMLSNATENPNITIPSALAQDLGSIAGHSDGVGWQNGETTFPMQGNQVADGSKGTDGCAADDVFSDLFHSFINEEVFMHQQNKIDDNITKDAGNNVNSNNNKHVEMIDPVGTSSSFPSFGLEGLWDDAFTNYFG